jgi:transcription elongation factor GreA
VAELEQILASVQVVDPPDPASNGVTFGATVTVKDKKGRTETYTVVGVDELDLEPDAISWISPIGKALLAADMGDWITLEDGRTAKIVKVEARS